MAQQRRVKPAVGVAAVGLGIGAGALGLYRGAAADPPRPAPPTWAAPATAAGLIAEGRTLLRDNKLAEALAKAEAATKLGGWPTGGDTPDALRQAVVADGKSQIDDLTAQAKVLAGRGDAGRSQASLELARQIAAEIGLATAPPAAPVVTPVAAATSANTPTTVAQAIAFHPADPPKPPAVPSLPAAVTPPPSTLTLPPVVELPPVKPPAATPVAREPEKSLLPAVPPLSLNPSGPTLPPALPEVGGPTPPPPGETPVTLPKLATAAVGAALLAAPLPAQDAAPKPGPGPAESVTAPMPAPPAVTKDQFDALKADIDGLKEYKKQVQDLLQGKADGGGKSVLDAGVLKRLTDLEDKLEKLSAAVESMKQTVAGRTSMSPPATTPAAPTPKTAVRLVNDYPSELSLILNGTSHRLKVGETKTVDVTPGSFTYELIAEGAKPITRTIRDDETVTLRIK